MPTTFRIALLLLCVALPSLGSADEIDDQKPVKVTLYPAAAPRPALKYQLLPDFMDRIDGNAIVYLGLVKAEQNSFFSNHQLWEDMERWRDEPLEKLKDINQVYDLGESGPFYYIDQAARCTHSDWQLPIGRESYYEMLLPGIQESRQYARLLVTQARIAIAHGDQTLALHDIRNCYAIARHVADNETLVATLVGMAMANLASEQLLTLMQQPDAPNLYWALTQLPTPYIDLRAALDAEMHGLELSMPELRDLEKIKTADEWRAVLMKVAGEMPKWTSGPSWRYTPEMIVAKSLRTFPIAKRSLIEGGLAREEVEKMPVAKVILMSELQEFAQVRDDLAKCFALPYPQAVAALKEAREAERRRSAELPEVLPLVETFLPAIDACRTAQTRCDRTFAALRIFEALRIYAASHEGRLPQKLADVIEVPIPNDPMTDAPFQYEPAGNTARLTGPQASGQLFAYEITMSPAK